MFKKILTLSLILIIAAPIFSGLSAKAAETDLSKIVFANTENYDPTTGPAKLPFLHIIPSTHFKYLAGHEGEVATAAKWQTVITIDEAGQKEIEHWQEMWKGKTYAGVGGVFPGIEPVSIAWVYQPIAKDWDFTGSDWNTVVETGYLPLIDKIRSSFLIKAKYVITYGNNNSPSTCLTLEKRGNWGLNTSSNWINVTVQDDLTGIHEYAHAFTDFQVLNLYSEQPTDFVMPYDINKQSADDKEQNAAVKKYYADNNLLDFRAFDWFTKQRRMHFWQLIWNNVPGPEDKTYPAAGQVHGSWFDDYDYQDSAENGLDPLRVYNYLTAMMTTSMVERSLYKKINFLDGTREIGQYSYKLVNPIESILCWLDGKPQGSILAWTQKQVDAYEKAGNKPTGFVADITGGKYVPLVPPTPTPAPTPAPTPPPNLTLVVNGKAVDTGGVDPHIDENSRTMVPVKFIVEALGAKVDWDGAKRLVTVTAPGITITLTIGEKILYVNGAAVQMDTAAVIKFDRTYVPVKYIAEALGMTVGWNGESKTVSLTSK